MESSRTYRAANLEELQQKQRIAKQIDYKLNPQKYKDRAKEYHKNHRKKNIENMKKYLEKVRDEAFEVYGGPICKCCGENNKHFLSLDHINNDGAEHRRKDYTSGSGLHYWVKKKGYPPGFQVLCMQCNFAKGKLGYCPHEKMKTPIDLFFASH